MQVKKKVITETLVTEFKDDCTPVQRMRNRDTDGDGRCDYIDNEYTKPYKFREISADEYRRLKDSGYCRNRNDISVSESFGKYIVRYTENQESDLETIIHPVSKHKVTK